MLIRFCYGGVTVLPFSANNPIGTWSTRRSTTTSNTNFVYETEQECRLSENLGDCEEVVKAGRLCLLRRTAGLRLYLMFACTSNSLKTLIMFTLSLAEQSTKPHSQSSFTIDSTISFCTCRWSWHKSILLHTTTIGTLGPRFSTICQRMEWKIRIS